VIEKPDLNHTDNPLNKCHLQAGQYDHILGAGIAANGANITVSNEPLYPRTRHSTSVPEYASKRADQQVSKGTEVHLESLTSAKVCENVADEQLKVELKRYAKILRDYEKFGKEQKEKTEPTVLEAEKARKPNTKNKGEYTKRQENRDIKRWEAIKAEERARKAG